MCPLSKTRWLDYCFACINIAHMNADKNPRPKIEDMSLEEFIEYEIEDLVEAYKEAYGDDEKQIKKNGKIYRRSKKRVWRDGANKKI